MLNLTFTRYIFKVFIIAKTINVAYAAPIIPNSIIRYMFNKTARIDEINENQKV